MKHYNLFIKTAFLFAVLICCSNSNAQEYNNWLLNDGNILNFNTSPATLICKNDANIEESPIALSDRNGELFIYGHRTSTKKEYGHTQTNYIIKNSNNDTVVYMPSTFLPNVIAAKSIDGYYYIAMVCREKVRWHYYLKIYKFDENANLLDAFASEYDGFTPIITFVRKRNDYLKLLAYNEDKKVIETYTMGKKIIAKTHEQSINLEKIKKTDIIGHQINISLNTKKIIISDNMSRICYILDYDYNTDKISVSKSFDIEYYTAMSFSENDKYFLIAEKNKLKAFKLDSDLNFDHETPDIIYDLGIQNIRTWYMTLGNDGKLYMNNYNYITVIDGIENEHITSEIIQSECLTNKRFPQMLRLQKIQSAPCPETEKPKIICE